MNTANIDWQMVRSATYEVQQSLRYEYPGPIQDVRQVLILIPSDQIGGQRLLRHELQVTPNAQPRFSSDRFGNRLCHVALPSVDGSLEFQVTVEVERGPAKDVPMTNADEAAVYAMHSPLSEPSPELEAIAGQLVAETSGEVELAERINDWVYHHVTYTQNVTGVRTTADDVLRTPRGVCQDYAHLMIALCRIAGLPARYVSGHLLGEGAMHAWTQVLLPRQDTESVARTWQPFDPTHGRRAGMPYITVAIGRDFGDVSPTRGSFRAPYAGRLAGGHKMAGVLKLELD
ncbi:MAG: transglutaminase family protein [Dehalococcoidia bacterium]